MDSVAARRVDGLLFAGGVAGMGLLLGVVGAALLYRSRLSFQINYNEGWNSYVAARVLDGSALYPERSTRLINNYPPLWFYVVALAAKLTGSVLVAGRALAWCGYAGCAAVIGLILGRMGAGWRGAAFGSLFFATVLAVRCDLYVGMFDPQLFAQLVMLSGLLVLLSRPDAAGAAVAAALMVAGGFLKHSLIALPAATTAWLLLYRRGALLAWLAAGIACAAAGLVASATAYGPGFSGGLALPRQTSLAAAVNKMLRWLQPLELPCVLATLPALLGGDAMDRERGWGGAAFVLIYLAAGFGAGVAGAAPLGTNYNMIFELLVAVSLGLGLLVGPAAPRIPAGWVSAGVCACLYATALQLATAEDRSWRAWTTVMRGRDAEARAEVALIRAAPGEALCGTLLLCYQAGKAMAFDPLNAGMAPGETQAGLQLDLSERRFGVVQVDPGSQYLNEDSLRALRTSYHEVPGQSRIYIPN